MFRYAIPADNQPHVHQLTADPVAVAAALEYDEACGYHHCVEFWCEHTDGAPEVARSFQVFGTGHALPDGARWWGTAERTGGGLVWHLYEIAGSEAAN